jgi:hypothetical protein
MKMNQALLQRVLDGDQSAIAQFVESDNCAVIDWRDGLPELVAAVEPFLPEGYLRLEPKRGEFLLYAGGRDPKAVKMQAQSRQEDLIASLNGALIPDFELRQFTPIEGDGYALFVAPATVWQDMERSHAIAVQKYFLSAERLVAYWRKGYLARLFSKP